MRPEPEGQPPAVVPALGCRRAGQRKVRLVTEERSYRLITPLFGGGVEPGAADPVTTIRGPEIRGQLRFWWRACRGGQSNGDLQDMREKEEALWGAASTASPSGPSQVIVEVVTEKSGGAQNPYSLVPDEKKKDPHSGKQNQKVRPNPEVAPPYAAFPLQPTEEEVRQGGSTQTRAVRSGVEFTLRITYPSDQRAEVEAALWAWETFGGVGARTRRGFGALQLLKVDGRAVALPATDGVKEVIREGIARHVTDGRWPDGVPHLSRELFGGNLKIACADENNACFTNPISAWKHLIKQLQDFRQSRNKGRRGRSLWPEPDAIRRITGQRAAKHAHELSRVDKFPRAAFGLPIVFHFKDAKVGDPGGTITLAGKKVKRLASPLILRPFACAGGAVGLALVLEGTGVHRVPGGLQLTQAREGQKPREMQVEPLLTPAEAKQISPLGGEQDVLRAFLATFQKTSPKK